MQNLAEYVDELRKRHPRLSMRQMAMEAGVGESVVNGIVKRGLGATPATLKALADRWGTYEDYAEMMRLAGHPMPDASPLDPVRRMVLRRYEELDADTRHRVDAILAGEENAEPESDISLETLLQIVMALTEQERRRWIARGIQELQDRMP